MKLSTNYPTLTYTHDDFLIDIVYNVDSKMYESWLYHKDYGVKKHMFGVATTCATLEEFVYNFVVNSLEHYIKDYEREVIENV